MFVNETQPIQLLHFKLSTHKTEVTTNLLISFFHLLTFVRWQNFAIEIVGYQKCRIKSSVQWRLVIVLGQHWVYEGRICEHVRGLVDGQGERKFTCVNACPCMCVVQVYL